MKTYPVPAILRFAGRLPTQTQIEGRYVIGALGTQTADPRLWKEPPHRVLANLPRFNIVTAGQQALLDDPHLELRRDDAWRLLPELVELKAMEGFVKKHGVLCGNVDFESRTPRFKEDAAEFTDIQDNLRMAWAGDATAIGEIEVQASYELDASASVNRGAVELTIENLRSLVAVLFLLDRAAGRVGVCANPECPAPYFLRKRKDQKFCERGACTVYAQRKYALGWWERKGYELRAKKLKHRAGAKRSKRT